MAKTKRSIKTTGRLVNSDTSKSTTSNPRTIDNQVVAQRRTIKGPDVTLHRFDMIAPRQSKAEQQHNTVAKEFDARIYGRLLTKTTPKVIDSQDEYNRLEAKFENLLDKGDTRTPEEDSLFDLLANLLEDYEKRTLPPLELTSPVTTLKFLMEENGLNQKDMVEYFGSQGNVSQVLSGKREISKGAAQKLSERFKLSTDIFLKHV